MQIGLIDAPIQGKEPPLPPKVEDTYS